MPHMTFYEGPLRDIPKLFSNMNELLHGERFPLAGLGFSKKHYQGGVSWWSRIKV
jgi:hypothetical protein